MVRARAVRTRAWTAYFDLLFFSFSYLRSGKWKTRLLRLRLRKHNWNSFAAQGGAGVPFLLHGRGAIKKEETGQLPLATLTRARRSRGAGRARKPAGYATLITSVQRRQLRIWVFVVPVPWVKRTRTRTYFEENTTKFERDACERGKNTLWCPKRRCKVFLGVAKSYSRSLLVASHLIRKYYVESKALPHILFMSKSVATAW